MRLRATEGYAPRMGKLTVFVDIWKFMRARRQWWLAPLIVIIVMFAFLLIFAQTSPLAPFIYTLF